MKFAGLILICASSCLALILPAFGVVQFPKVAHSNAAPQSPESLPVSVNAPPNSPFSGSGNGLPNGSSWTAARSTSNTEVLPNDNNAFVSTPFPAPTQSPIQSEPNSMPSMQTAPPSPASKIGMGVWLLLGPVCLIGLALWTFSPNPSGAKSRFGK